MAAGNYLPQRAPNEGAPPSNATPLSALPRVAALVLGRLDRARLQDAVKGIAVLDPVDRVASLEQLVARTIPRVSAVIAEPYDSARTPTAPTLARLRADYPGIALIAYCSPGHRHCTEILSLANAGVNELVFRGVDDTAVAFRQALARASQSSAAREVLEALRSLVAPDAVWIVEACVQYAWPNLNSRELAQALGLNIKTLLKHCRSGGLPSPGALLNWVRLMIVAYLIEAEGRALDHVAGAFGFESASPLRNLMKRYTGLRALEVRQSGGLRVVVEAFLRPDAFGRQEVRSRQRLPDGEADADDDVPEDA